MPGHHRSFHCCCSRLLPFIPCAHPTHTHTHTRVHRSMLADRLLCKGSDYDCDRELRTLELLKLRFGESSLHNAEVMLKVRLGTTASWVTVMHTILRLGQICIGEQHLLTQVGFEC